MNFVLKHIHRVLGVGVAVGLTGVASAALIEIQSLQYGGSTNFLYNGVSSTFWAGEQRVRVDQGSGYGTPFDAYCIDIEHLNGLGNIYTITPLPTSFLASGFGGKAAWLYNTYAPGVSTNTQGAGLQLALWDVIYDGGDGLLTGNVRKNGSNASTIVAQATTYLNALGSNTSSAVWLKATHVGNKYQDLIGPTDSVHPVPEPFTMLLGAAGLGLAARRRLRA